MIFTLVTLLASLLCVSADNSTNSTNYCQVLPAGTNEIQGLLYHAFKYLYAQQRFGPPIIAERCWSTRIFPTEFNILDNSLNPMVTLYDPREEQRNVQAKMAFIENDTKFTVHYKGSVFLANTIALTPDYAVTYFCRENEQSVVILTAQKHRDEKIIQSAIEAAKKILTLPSPSVNMECDELIGETTP